MSFFAREHPRSSWARSYKLSHTQTYGPNEGFLFHQTNQKLTWKELVNWAKNINKITFKTVPSNRIYYHATESGKRNDITHIDGTLLVGQVDPNKLGTTAAVPYLHAESLLYNLYTKHGGKLKRHEISFSKIPGINDAIY